MSLTTPSVLASVFAVKTVSRGVDRPTFPSRFCLVVGTGREGTGREGHFTVSLSNERNKAIVGGELTKQKPTTVDISPASNSSTDVANIPININK